MTNFAELSAGEGVIFLVRWRGRQEGPYLAPAIEAKLAANEIGLLHEIYYEGKWITIRDYITQKESVRRTTSQAQAESERSSRQEAERRAREREGKPHVPALEASRSRSTLPPAILPGILPAGPGSPAAPLPPPMAPPLARPMARPAALKPHRGNTIIILGVVGLVFCGPVCLAAWLMGSKDLREMDEGAMDDSGRANTNLGQILGISGTFLWVVVVLFFLIIRQTHKAL